MRPDVRRVAESHGFDLWTPWASDLELRDGIREVDGLARGSTLTEQQRRALMENVRRVFLRTASAPEPAPSLAAQAKLYRWWFLRQASAEAANAYAALLAYFDIGLPDSLGGPLQ
jgi:hypothetical protein